MNIERIYGSVREEVARVGTRTGMNLVAFSGGVDSSVVARVVHDVFPDRSRAVLGVSPSLSREQRELAERVAVDIGIVLYHVGTEEVLIDAYRANEGMSCYHCKRTLYTTMTALAEHGRATYPDAALFNGTNADDLADPTRVGLIAAREHGVHSPLQALPKSIVRELARHLGLPHWNYAASPCLRSRLSIGVTATIDNLSRIGEAERRIRALARIAPEHDFRVRHLAGDVAMIECPEQLLPDIDLAACGRELRPLGFVEIRKRAFRSGAVAHPTSPTP